MEGPEERETERVRRNGGEGRWVLPFDTTCVGRLSQRDLRPDWLPLIRESGLLMRGEFRDYKYQRYREPDHGHV